MKHLLCNHNGYGEIEFNDMVNKGESFYFNNDKDKTFGTFKLEKLL